MIISVQGLPAGNQKIIIIIRISILYFQLAGKSHWLKELEREGYAVVPEIEWDRQALKNFYENPKRYGFAFQMYTLYEMIEMNRRAVALSKPDDKVVIIERSLLSCR